MTDVSVIIPHYNDLERLSLCLEALSAQTLPRERFEVIVADNGSERDPAGPLAGSFPWVRVVRETAPGSYAARNAAIGTARGRVLAFTDSDCIPSPGWLASGLAVLDGGEADCVVGHVEVFPRDESRPRIAELYDMLYFLRQEDNLRSNRFGATANLIVRRDAFERVGPFNAQMRSGGDMEWGNRAHDAGLRFRFVREAMVRHPARDTLRGVARKRLRVAGGLAQKGVAGRASARREGPGARFASAARSALWLVFPRPRAFRHVVARDGRLSPAQRTAVALVIVWLHYFTVLERVRVRLGAEGRR